MKNYLDLVPISQKVHRRQSRMVRLCIILSVFLITAIFGMADMEIRSQNAQARINYGEWHAGFRDMSDEDTALIDQRPKVLSCTRYNTLNYRLTMHYQVEGTETVIIGMDESALDIFPTAQLVEGCFPKEEGGAVIDQNMKDRLSLELGDEILLTAPDGTQMVYRITGFSGQMPMLAEKDIFGLMLRTEDFRKLSLQGAEDNYDSFIYVKFSPRCNIQKEIREIQEAFQIPDEHVGRNELLLATIGQSQDVSMMAIYVVALILAGLVAVAGILMITGSLSSNIAQRTAFFGMLRCLGATRKQVISFVRREALCWCKSAIPEGMLLGTVIVWVLSALLRMLSPRYFGEMPHFGISWIGMIAGSVIGVITVFVAAGSPAKKAAGVSPLTAVSGNASEKRKIKKAANTRFYKIETALGIHHAKGSRKNFILMSCSFAFSIILFLTFSVAVDFMKHAVNPLKPSAPDVSIVSSNNTCSIDKTLAQELAKIEGVKRVYGRSFAYDVPIQTQTDLRQAYLISYETCQMEWAKDSLIEGSLSEAMEGDGLLAVYHGEGSLKAGENVSVHLAEDKVVSGVLSECPFNATDGQEILICSEETFTELTGERGYTIIDLQLARNADDGVIQKIRETGGENVTFSDRRLNNEEVKGAVWSLRLFIYGFLGVIALICVFHIMNSIAMSVSARIRQYGAMRAVGMDSGQMLKMTAAEAVSYGAMGIVIGCGAGVPLNWFCFKELITLRWGTEWYFPVVHLCVIGIVVLGALGLAIYGPAKRIRNMSVVNTISGV